MQGATFINEENAYERKSFNCNTDLTYLIMTETEIFSLFQEFHNIKSHHHFSSEICNMDISN